MIFEGEYKNGVKWNGKGKEFNYKDALIFEGEYFNGKIWNGKNIAYDALNKKRAEYEYKNGEINKKLKEYDENGNLIYEAIYLNGEKKEN